jgi:predicted TIM-barrel fold metal-dependent hydrolase
LQIVDSQIHLWENAMMPKHHKQVDHYSVEEAVRDMEEAGVDAAVIHPPESLGDQLDINEFSVGAVRKYPDKFCILGWFDLRSPDRREIVKRWRERTGMLGFRYIFCWPYQQTWWSDGSLDWFWEACEEEGLPIGLLAGEHMPEFRSIAERHPGLKLHLDHMGRAGRKTDDEAFENLEELLDLAGFQNVAVKLSGAPSYSSQAYPFKNIHDYIRRIFDAFGPSRCFWGTDITRMPCSYRECVTMFTEELPWLRGRDKELVMGDAICEWIGWNRGGQT